MTSEVEFQRERAFSRLRGLIDRAERAGVPLADLEECKSDEELVQRYPDSVLFFGPRLIDHHFFPLALLEVGMRARWRRKKVMACVRHEFDHGAAAMKEGINPEEVRYAILMGRDEEGGFNANVRCSHPKLDPFAAARVAVAPREDLSERDVLRNPITLTMAGLRAWREGNLKRFARSVTEHIIRQ